jgi:hypothetical protein
VIDLKLYGWSFVAATLTLLASPTVLHAADAEPPTSEVRSSNDGPDAESKRTVPRYASYPHEEGTRGYIQRTPRPVGTPVFGDDSPAGRRTSWRIAYDIGHAGPGLASKDVMRNSVSIRRTWWRLGVDGDFTHFLDRTGEPRLDHSLTLTRVNLVFAPVLRPRFTWWAGVGTNAVVDMHRYADGRNPVAFGPNVTSSIDVFPGRFFVVSGRVDLGRAGQAPALAARGTAGLMLGRVEAYGGYEVARLGDRSLRGPIIGLRVWF